MWDLKQKHFKYFLYFLKQRYKTRIYKEIKSTACSLDLYKRNFVQVSVVDLIA